MANTTITYDGKTTTVQSGKTATLPCDKKLMKSNVVVVAGGGSGTLTVNAEYVNQNVNVDGYEYVYFNIPEFDPAGKVTIT